MCQQTPNQPPKRPRGYCEYQLPDWDYAILMPDRCGLAAWRAIEDNDCCTVSKIFKCAALFFQACAKKHPPRLGLGAAT